MFGIVYNPASGKGQGEALLEQIQALVAQRGEECRLYATQFEGDGRNQAQKAMDEGCSAIVSVGGDGTLSEVVSAMAGSEAVLYIVPRGTGNDFARMFSLPKDPLEAFKAQLGGTKCRIDLGSINGTPFINVSGSGFDVEVLRKTEELKHIYPGEQAYLRAVLSTLRQYKPVEMDFAVDGGAYKRLRATIIEIANGRYFGGGMRVAPDAAYDDGLFDVVYIKPVYRCMIPFLLPLFILGVHVYLPIVKVTRAKTVSIRADRMTVNIDGRLEEMNEANFEILPQALSVMRP